MWRSSLFRIILNSRVTFQSRQSNIEAAQISFLVQHSAIEVYELVELVES